MTCMIQGMMPLNYLYNVNLNNYGHSHVLKVLHLSVLSPNLINMLETKMMVWVKLY
jgi:hypothetical protein